MKSWHSKVSLTFLLAASCAGLNSCKLFGGGDYSSQLEVETEVPDSLEHGKASSGPQRKDTGYVTTAASVPADSNLVDLPEIPGQAPLPTVGTAHTGGASMTGMPSGGYDNVEIPKPDFGSVSLNSPASRPPAEMISLGPPSGTTPRMALNNDPAAHTYTSKVAEEKLEPLTSPDPIPSAAELASAPSATKDPAPARPGVPLLHSGTRLADYYQNLHSAVLDKSVVENVPAADPGAEPPPPPPAAAEDLSVPPPPPAPEETAPPEPPPAQ